MSILGHLTTSWLQLVSVQENKDIHQVLTDKQILFYPFLFKKRGGN